MSTQDIDGVSLMDGEEILHDVEPHWLFRLQEGLRHYIMDEARYIVTSERVIAYTETMSGLETRAYPMRDIQQLRTDASNAQQWLDVGNITFSVGGAGDKIVLEAIPEHQSVATTIRERQRELAES